MNDLQDALDFYRKNRMVDSTTQFRIIWEAARRWVAVQEAITNEGPQPRLHRSIMKRHKKEWPTLWAALGITTEDT